MPRLIPVIVALGSNLGNRGLNLRRAVEALRGEITVVRVSSAWETDPVDCPPDSPAFLNAVALGVTPLLPGVLLDALLGIERMAGRRRGARNVSRVIDLDLILYGSWCVRETGLVIPHPRFSDRSFVLEPMRELDLPWCDPVSGRPVRWMKGEGRVVRKSALY